MLGLLRLHVETEPQALWVGPRSQVCWYMFACVDRALTDVPSQALKDKIAYESAFGPFYRIEQLILSTQAPSGEPTPIVTNANLQLLFAMQAKVDALQVTVNGTNITLQDVCFKPFGDVCATQSVLQYWHMDPAAFAARGTHTPEYCFQHTTECRSAFQAPIDPQLVLGGFPRDPGQRRNMR